MRVARTGCTPVKGARHQALESVTLTPAGVVGDRAFCLVDPARDRCLRTVEQPALLRASAEWADGVLTVDLPSGRVSGRPEPAGTRTVDYWGRATEVEVVAGPWAAAYADHLGCEVLLVACPPGAVVYGAAVTVVTRASLDRLADEVGERVDAARFRATIELDGDLRPWQEDGWVGRRLRVGRAELVVRDVVTRCAVVDHDPHTGLRDLPLLSTLPRIRPRRDPVFGVEADVVVPGEIAAGDRAELVADPRARGVPAAPARTPRPGRR